MPLKHRHSNKNEKHKFCLGPIILHLSERQRNTILCLLIGQLMISIFISVCVYWQVTITPSTNQKHTFHLNENEAHVLKKQKNKTKQKTGAYNVANLPIVVYWEHVHDGMALFRSTSSKRRHTLLIMKIPQSDVSKWHLGPYTTGAQCPWWMPLDIKETLFWRTVCPWLQRSLHTWIFFENHVTGNQQIIILQVKKLSLNDAIGQ